MQETMDETKKADWHPLPEGEAHDEANMMRANMKLNPDTGYVKNPGLSYEDESRPTPEDYNYALNAIEQLKKAAADEPNYQKVLLQISRVVARPFQEFFHALDAVSPITTKTFNEMHERRMHALDDSEKRLRAMRESGQNFGDAEAAHHPNVKEEK
ncbi:MAG: hypothetical protein P4L74_06065 [Candidatus Doudnabacteria bacterium]|nr:hypothetical protein [Candidatus Doudnabacteria bacterium]